MADPKLIVLFFSQYSEDCKRFLTTMQRFGLDYITPVCIDNINIRQKVRDTIKQVPTIMFIYDDSMIETYQGEKAMLWLDNNIQPIQEKLEREDRERMYQAQILAERMRTEQQPEIPVVKKPRKKVIEVDENDDEDDEEEKDIRRSKKTTSLTEVGGKKTEKDRKREDLVSRANDMERKANATMSKIFPPLGPKRREKEDEPKRVKGLKIDE